MKEYNDQLMNMISVVEILHGISRTSNRGLRILTKGLKQETDATLQQAQKDTERMEKKLLNNRWWRAKEQLRCLPSNAFLWQKFSGNFTDVLGVLFA